MDDRFEFNNSDEFVYDKSMRVSYADGSPVLVGDVVFNEDVVSNTLTGPHIVQSVAVTRVETSIMLVPMSNICVPRHVLVIGSADSLRRATRADIEHLEHKWSPSAVIEMVDKLRSEGKRIVLVWHTRTYELIVFDTGGKSLVQVSLSDISRALQNHLSDDNFCNVFDYNDFTDITFDDEAIRSLHVLDLSRAATADLRPFLLSDADARVEFEKWLRDEREVPKYVIDEYSRIMSA